jgi:hypothetical protein
MCGSLINYAEDEVVIDRKGCDYDTYYVKCKCGSIAIIGYHEYHRYEHLNDADYSYPDEEEEEY